VKAGSVRVDGQIKGNLNAKTKVQLSASARLEGDVQTQRLEVAEGAVLVGRCVVGVNGQSKPTTDVRSVSRPAEMIPAAKARMPDPAPVMVKK